MEKRQRQQAIEYFIDAINQDGATFVGEVIAEFDKQEHLKEDALKLLFHEVFTADDDIRGTLVKVTCLNEFYSTGLNSNPPLEEPTKRIAVDILTLAKHIHDLESSHSLNNLIRAGNLDAVELICSVADDARARPYSFATKYCNWHNPESYPIVDGYSKAMVYYLSKALGEELQGVGKVIQDDLLDYNTFCRLFEAIKKWVNQRCSSPRRTYSTKDLDKCLWYYAKHKTGKASIYIP